MYSAHETGQGLGRDYVTIFGTGSASGLTFSTRPSTCVTHGADAGALYGVSTSGWMEQANFFSWFEKMLVPAVSHVLFKGPVVLFCG